MSKEHEQQEDKARANGWKPLEEFDGNKDDWISAKEFNTRGNLIAQIQTAKSQSSALKSEIDEMKGTFKEFQKFHEQALENERKEAKKELMAEKAAALKDNNTDRVVEIDEDLALIRDEEKKAKAEKQEKPQKTSEDPAVQKFAQAHPEFEEDPVLQGAFASVVQKNRALDPSKSPAEILQESYDELVELKPQLFDFEEEEEKPKRQSKVSSYGKRTSKSSSGKATAADLDDYAREVGTKFVKMGLIKDLDTYAQQLAADEG